MSSPSSCSSWESLPVDLLELLVGSLESFFDRLRFGAVCRSWREAAAAIKGRPGRPTLPILTFCEPEDGGGGAESTAGEAGAIPIATRCFYSLSEDKIYRRKVLPWSRDWRILGTSHGWLALVDLYATPFLFNPISGERVDLPSLATLGPPIVSVRRREPLHRLHPVEEKRRLWLYTGEYIRRLVLSSSPLDPDCIAMATLLDKGTLCPLVYARPGGDSWVPVQSQLIWHPKELHYHDGRFYAFSLWNTVSIRFTKPPCDDPVVEVFAWDPRDNWYLWQDVIYLVALASGEIIKVVKHVEGPKDGDDCWAQTKRFDFYRVEAGSNGREWVKVDTMDDDDDCCLFLGYNQSLSLPPLKVLGKYRSNCIFFTDDCRHVFLEESYGGLDFGIYHIEDEIIDRFCPMKARRLMPPPMWIAP